MSDRLPMESVNIPANANRSIVMDRFRRNGIDPRKAIHNPMCRAISVAWSRGEIDATGFDRSCVNMLIMNPGLAAGVDAR